MPYKDIEKAREANRNSYHKYRSQRIEWSREYYQKTKEVKRAKSRLGHIKKYGLNQKAFEQLWKSQNGLCAICYEALGEGIQCHIDHNHETNEVRGLLCKSYNNGLGFFKDNSKILLQAIKYLKVKGRGNGG